MWCLLLHGLACKHFVLFSPGDRMLLSVMTLITWRMKRLTLQPVRDCAFDIEGGSKALRNPIFIYFVCVCVCVCFQDSGLRPTQERMAVT